MESPSISSPFKTVLNSVGPQHEKALKQAFYNTAALIFAFLCSIGLVIASRVLEPFLRPLVWAALCGAFLYPFKRELTLYVNSWLCYLEKSETSLTVGTIKLPFTMVDGCSEGLWSIVKKNIKLMVGLLAFFSCAYFLIIYHPFYQIFLVLEAVTAVLLKILGFFEYSLAVWTIFIGFVAAVLFLYDPDSEDQTVLLVLQYAFLFVWLVMIFHLVSLAGAWKIPLAVFMFVLVIVGFATDKKFHSNCADAKTLIQDNISIKQIVDRALTLFGILKEKVKSDKHRDLSRCSSAADIDMTGGIPESISSAESTPETSLNEASLENKVDFIKQNPSIEAIKPTPANLKKSIIIPKPRLKHSGKKKKKRIGKSDPYFVALFWVFAISRVWMNLWILPIIPFFILFYVAKNAFIKLELAQFFMERLKEQDVSNRFLAREDVIVPSPIKTLLIMLRLVDRKVLEYIKRSLDNLISILMILCLLVGVVLATVFFATQVQYESSYLITVATDVVNNTITSNQDYLRYLNLNESDIRSTLDENLHKAYMLGRKKMARFVTSSFFNKDTNTTEIEYQILQFLDQLYDTWILRKNDTDKVKGNSSKTNSISQQAQAEEADKQRNFISGTWHKLVNYIRSQTDFAKVVEMLKENIHTLYSVLDSIWLILKGNANILFAIITNVASLLFVSGTYLLNGVISSIIFTTTLFYLLSTSSKEYKLVELFAGISMGTRLGESIADAIQDVFGAALKMATFYGFYTWFTHSVFGANLVFIPAAIAALLGVVPFIGTYWAALPATMELWLIQQQGVLAVLLFILHMLPTYVVDTAIYSEIGGGGHPYMTGLAVAGGVYCIGLEGAFVGPIVLCCLIAAFDVYNDIMKEDKMDPTIAAATVWRMKTSDDRK